MGVPIYRVRCCGCGAVFTVLPSFILRYRRQDSDCLSKLLTLSLSMGLSQRQTATIYTWSGMERNWTPGWVWSLLHWLGKLLPVAWLLLRLGLQSYSRAWCSEEKEIKNAGATPRGEKRKQDTKSLSANWVANKKSP